MKSAITRTEVHELSKFTERNVVGSLNQTLRPILDKIKGGIPLSEDDIVAIGRVETQNGEEGVVRVVARIFDSMRKYVPKNYLNQRNDDWKEAFPNGGFDQTGRPRPVEWLKWLKSNKRNDIPVSELGALDALDFDSLIELEAGLLISGNKFQDTLNRMTLSQIRKLRQETDGLSPAQVDTIFNIEAGKMRTPLVAALNEGLASKPVIGGARARLDRNSVGAPLAIDFTFLAASVLSETSSQDQIGFNRTARRFIDSVRKLTGNALFSEEDGAPKEAGYSENGDAVVPPISQRAMATLVELVNRSERAAALEEDGAK